MPREIISLENVSYSYSRGKKPALENINLSIMEGEFLAVMGENGAGKTSLCKLLNGVIPHSAGGRLTGTVTVDGGQTIKSSVPEIAVKVGMVLDDPDVQVFTSSVRHEAAFGPENLLLPPEEIEKRVAYALAAVGLAGFEDRKPVSLSGGEKQRLAIACVLAMNGKILVLDEPLSRLDPEGAAEVMAVLQNLRAQYGITVVMATHNSGKAAEFADRVCVLKNGRVTACDTARNIFADNDLLRNNGIQTPDNVDIYGVFSADSGLQAKPEAIAVKGLCYSYEAPGDGIENIDLSVADNDFVAVIGRNGCGKTTLLKNIAGLLRPRAGKVYIRGKDAEELSVSDISKEAGFVMQNPDSQLFTDSVYTEVSFALKNSGLSKTEIRRRAEEALRIMGLDDPCAFPHALSRADRAKTVIASVLASGCKIIILDEVDVGQDYSGSIKIMNIARELHAKGYAIIFVTHNMSLVCEYAQRLIIMDRKGIITDRRRGNIA